MGKFLKYIVTIIVIAIVADSCTKDKGFPDSNLYSDSDQELLNEVNSITTKYWYQNDSTILHSIAGTSGHPPYFRVWFNKIAFSALTEQGKLPQNTQFPNGSLIVKELYREQGGELALLAIMKRENGNQYQAENWLWVEANADGSSFINIKDQGKACTSCHSENSRDYVKLFNLF